MSLLKLISEANGKCDLLVNTLVGNWIGLQEVLYLDSSFCNKIERTDFFLPILSSIADISKPNHHRSFTGFKLDFMKSYKETIIGGVYMDFPEVGHIYTITSYRYHNIITWINKRKIQVTCLTFVNCDYENMSETYTDMIDLDKVTFLALFGETNTSNPNKSFYDDSLEKQRCLSEVLNSFPSLSNLLIEDTPSFTAFTISLLEPSVLQTLECLDFEWTSNGPHGNANEALLGIVNHAHKLKILNCRNNESKNDFHLKSTVHHTTIDLILQLNLDLVELRLNFVQVTTDVMSCIKLQGINLLCVEIIGTYPDNDSSEVSLISLGEYIVTRPVALRYFCLKIKSFYGLKCDFVVGGIAIANFDMMSRKDERKVNGEALVRFFEILSLTNAPLMEKSLGSIKSIKILWVNSILSRLICLVSKSFPELVDLYFDNCFLSDDFDSMPIRWLVWRCCRNLKTISFMMSDTSPHEKNHTKEYLVDKNGWFRCISQRLWYWGYTEEYKTILLTIHPFLLEKQPGHLDNLLPQSPLFRIVDGKLSKDLYW